MSLAVPRVRIEIPELHAAQQQIVDGAGRFNVVDCGRRFGKDVLGIDRVVEIALEGYPTGWFSPTYKNLTEDWRESVRILGPVVSRKDEQEHRLDLVTGGVVEMWSLDRPDAARGRRYRRIVINEAAMVPNLQDAWELVIRPTLVDYKGDAWMLSTPRGYNYFRTMYQRGQDPDQPDWHSWRFPTSANPFIPASEIDAARRELPERVYLQEFEAEFLDSGGGVFRQVLAATTAGAQVKAEPGHSYVIGADWGRAVDYTVFQVIDLKTREHVCQDRSNQVEYVQQRGRLRALCERFKPQVVVAEQNSIGEPIIEQLRREGIPVRPFVTTNATKAEIIDGLALAFERGDLRILNDSVLVSELQAYEMERLPSGLIRYGAPNGLHDDCVMSLALAWYAASQGRLPFGFVKTAQEARR